jgi:hypothetical protein
MLLPLAAGAFDMEERTEVVGSDNKHVGTVDRLLEGAEEILLTKDDPKSGGLNHVISMAWVDYVDRRVHLHKSPKAAMSECQAAA